MGDKHQPKCPTNPMSHLFLNWQCQCNVDGIRFGSVWQIESRCEHNTNPKKKMSAEIQLWRKKRVNPNQLMCELDWEYYPPLGDPLRRVHGPSQWHTRPSSPTLEQTGLAYLGSSPRIYSIRSGQCGRDRFFIRDVHGPGRV